MKKILKLIITYIVSGIISLILLAILLHTDILESVDIFLYRCWAYSLIAVFILAIILVFLNKLIKFKFMDFGIETIISSIIICLLGLSFFSSTILLPMDRSYTIFMLADMTNNKEQLYTRTDIEETFIDGYIKEYNETGRRITEQELIGNIEKDKNKYQITEKGERLIYYYRIIDIIFPVDKKTSIYPK